MFTSKAEEEIAAKFFVPKQGSVPAPTFNDPANALPRAAQEIEDMIKERFQKLPAFYQRHTTLFFIRKVEDVAKFLNITVTANQLPTVLKHIHELSDNSVESGGSNLPDYNLWKGMTHIVYLTATREQLMKLNYWNDKDFIKRWCMLEVAYPLHGGKFGIDRPKNPESNREASEIANLVMVGTGNGHSVSSAELQVSTGEWKLKPENMSRLVFVSMHSLPKRGPLPQVFAFYSQGKVYSHHDFEMYDLPVYVVEIVKGFVRFAGKMMPGYEERILMLCKIDQLTFGDLCDYLEKIPASIRLFMLAVYHQVATLFGNNKQVMFWEKLSDETIGHRLASVDTLHESFTRETAVVQGFGGGDLADEGESYIRMISVANWDFQVSNPTGNSILQIARAKAKSQASGKTSKTASGDKTGKTSSGGDTTKQQEGGDAKKKKKKPLSQKRCLICHQKGHLLHACPKKAEMRQTPARRSNTEVTQAEEK